MSFVKLREDPKENDKIGGVVTSSPMSTSGVAGRPDAYLGKGTKVLGTLTFSGSAEIDCQVDGEIHSKDLLTISESAIVNGKIVGGEVIVKGCVNGDIFATKRLSVRKPAKIVGNISCPNISIEEGVVFEGKCSMNLPANATEAISKTEATNKGASSKP